MTRKISPSKVYATTVVAVLSVIVLFGSVAQAAVVFQDGFEVDLSNWTLHGTPTTVTTPYGVNATYIAQLPISDQTYMQYFFTPSDTVTLDYFFRIDTTNMNPDTSLKFAEICDAQGSPITRLYIACNGTGDLGWQFIYSDGSSSKIAFIPEGITQNVWYRITETLKTGASDAAFQLWIDSELVFSASNANSPNAAKGVNLGCLLPTGYSTGNIYFDTVTLTNTLDPLPTPTPSPTPEPTVEASPSPTPTATVTATLAPTAAPTTSPTDDVSNTTQAQSMTPIIITVVVIVVVVAAVAVVLVMRRRKVGSGLPPPPPPPPPT